jgi:hypothetical protein
MGPVPGRAELLGIAEIFERLPARDVTGIQDREGARKRTLASPSRLARRRWSGPRLTRAQAAFRTKHSHFVVGRRKNSLCSGFVRFR